MSNKEQFKPCESCKLVRIAAEIDGNMEPK
jgi:hypothetical protein